MRKVRCLVITPFDPAGKRIQDTIQRALSEMEIEPLLIDEVVSPGALLENAISDAIRSADFIVADVTRNNPNVTYEIGIAHGLRKPVIPIVSTDANSGLPSYLAGYQYIAYDPKNLRSLATNIQRVARAFTERNRG